MRNGIRLCGAAWCGFARGGGRVEVQRSKVNVTVNYHHHVLQVGNLSHFLHILHIPHIGHLHIIAQVQCYCLLSILYNSGLMQIERRKVEGYKLLCLF